MDTRHTRTKVFITFIAFDYSLVMVALLVLHLLGRDHRGWIAFVLTFLPFSFVPAFAFVLVGIALRARGALLLTLPIALLGSVLYGPLFLAKSSAHQSNPSLTIITFNVSEKNQQLGDVVQWLRLQNADIVVLQEVAHTWFEPLDSTLGDLYPYRHQRPTEHGSRGNLLLSRFPLLADASTSDPQRPFEALVLDIDGHPVTLYNVSLATPVANSAQMRLPADYSLLDLVFRYDDTLRNRQIEALLGQLEAVTTPYLVAGDFNMSDQMNVYTTLANRMGDSFREAGRGLGATWPASPAMGLIHLRVPLVRIDYVWHSGAFQAVSAEVGPYLGSDHLPLKVEMEYAFQSLGNH